MTSLKPPGGLPSTMPLALTIRFSVAVPDLDLDIPYPASTTVVSLKHLIRTRLAEPTSQRRLRFIQGGKILPDTAALSSVLRAPPPPPPSANDGWSSPTGNGLGDGADSRDQGGKGKGVVGKMPTQRIYINCSIGDSLTDVELAEEARAAALPPSTTASSIPSTNANTNSPLAGGVAPNGINTPGIPLPSTFTAPRGFDRLLAAGFTSSEVNQLRLQFRSIHNSRFTPDTLPSPDSFRRMEDAWIDDNGAATMLTTAGATTGGFESGGGEDTGGGLAGHIEALIWGVMTGFMWPLGSFGWLTRESGIHSDRWRFMVGVGVLFSLLIGIVRGIAGDK